MLKLEEAGYVAMEKRFAGRKPQTVYRMTAKGREALAGYVSALKELLGGAL
jgi:DNA-binding PadR family transcriptional regulator